MDISRFDATKAMTTATQQAEEAVTLNLGTATAQLFEELQAATGGKTYLLKKVTAIMASTSFMQALVENVVAAAENDGAPTIGTTISTSSHTQPVVEMKLGQRLLEISGDGTKAVGLLEMLDHLTKNHALHRVVAGIVTDVTDTTRKDEDIVRNNAGRFVLKSYNDLHLQHEWLQDKVSEIAEKMSGITPGDTRTALDEITDGVAELKRLRSAHAPKPAVPAVDQDAAYLTVLENISGINANSPVTTFEKHLRVVLGNYEQRGETKFADVLKIHGKIEYVPGTSVRDYIDKVINSLRPATPAAGGLSSNDLEEIGNAFGIKRDGRSDNDYRQHMIERIEKEQKLANDYRAANGLARETSWTIGRIYTDLFAQKSGGLLGGGGKATIKFPVVNP